MCPLCASTLAWLGLGGSTASLAALLIGWKKKGNDHGDDCDNASDRDS